MGIFQRFSKSMASEGEDVDLDALMSAAEKPPSPKEAAAEAKADAYVKSVLIQTEADMKTVMDELAGKNIVLLNISQLSRNLAKLKAAVQRLTEGVRAMNGDIARVDDDKVLLTPANVKIVKKRK